MQRSRTISTTPASETRRTPSTLTELSIGVIACRGLELASIAAHLVEAGADQVRLLDRPDLSSNVLILREGGHVIAPPVLRGLPARTERQTRILVLSDSVEQMAAAMHAGADGALSIRTRPSVFVRSILEVVAGGTVVSPETLDLIRAGKGKIELDPLEQSVLDALSTGATDDEICAACNLTPAVVRRVIRALGQRWSVSTRLQIMTRAHRAGLLTSFTEPFSSTRVGSRGT